MNRIGMYLKNVTKAGRTAIVVLAVIFISAGIAQAATTISTNISTEGTLSVTGLATFLAGATTTQFTLLSGDTIKNASASSTVISGALQTTGGFTGTTGTFSSTLGITGLATFLGGASTTQFTLLSGDTIKNATASSTVISGALNTTGTLTVGASSGSSAITGTVFGYCSFADVTSFTASTTKYVDCTTVPTGKLLTTDRVFVQATSSFDAPFVITAASSTGVSTVNIRVLNTGLGAADETLGGTSIHFWAIR